MSQSSNVVKLVPDNKKVKDRTSTPFNVYVVGGGYEYIKMLYDLGYGGAKGLGEADIVLFTGGEDVDPSLYGEAALQQTRFNPVRDKREKAIYEEALKANIPMVGICRGGQFLNVMNGGKMWQHVDGHCGNHKMAVLGKDERIITVTSTHHQMMIPNEETALVLATANESSRKLAFNLDKTHAKGSDVDTEVVWYENTSCLCFQPHPEFGSAPAECLAYFDECMDNFIIPSTYNKKD